MTVRSIRILGDPVLHRRADPVQTNDDGSLPDFVAALIADMFDTLAASKGVGLAAPQVGVGLRIFVYDCPEVRGHPSRYHGVIINGVLARSEIQDRPLHDDDDEGCLSAPGVKFPIVRADWARVRGIDANGDNVDFQGTGLIARMLQHETAHLDGALYLDHLVQPYAESARQTIGAKGWGVPGLAWTPGEDPNPFQS
jgi:peptide deformylase